MLKIAAIQLSVDAEPDPAARVAAACSRIRSLPGDVDFAILPELWHVGAFDIAGFREAAEPLDGPLVNRLADVAKEKRIWLHGGSFVEIRDDSLTNTSVLFDSDGALVADYRKMHLFGFAGGEAATLTSGDEVVCMRTPLGLAGLSTCYDLRFPELYRKQRSLGAEVFLMPSGWPSRRITHWQVLTRARAIENQAALIGCNAAGTSAGTELGGCSVVVDALGDVTAIAGPQAETLQASLDPDHAPALREAFPVHDDRRMTDE